MTEEEFRSLALAVFIGIVITGYCFGGLLGAFVFPVVVFMGLAIIAG